MFQVEGRQVHMLRGEVCLDAGYTLWGTAEESADSSKSGPREFDLGDRQNRVATYCDAEASGRSMPCSR